MEESTLIENNTQVDECIPDDEVNIVKGEYHSFSIITHMKVLRKQERTKKTAGQKLFSFAHSGKFIN